MKKFLAIITVLILVLSGCGQQKAINNDSQNTASAVVEEKETPNKENNTVDLKEDPGDVNIRNATLNQIANIDWITDADISISTGRFNEKWVIIFWDTLSISMDESNLSMTSYNGVQYFFSTKEDWIGINNLTNVPGIGYVVLIGYVYDNNDSPYVSNVRYLKNGVDLSSLQQPTAEFWENNGASDPTGNDSSYEYNSNDPAIKQFTDQYGDIVGNPDNYENLTPEEKKFIEDYGEAWDWASKFYYGY